VSPSGSVSCSLTHRSHSPNLSSVISCVSVCRISVEGCLIGLAFCSTRWNDPIYSFYRLVDRYVLSFFLSSKMCLHVTIVKAVGTWSSRKYPGGKRVFDECCCKYAGIAGVAFCIMGPWNLAGGTHIFILYYCLCLQVRRYSEDGSSMFRRSAGPFCWTTRCRNSEGRRVKFYSQESVAAWTGILRLCRTFWLNAAKKWTYDIHNSSIVTGTVRVAGKSVSIIREFTNQLTFWSLPVTLRIARCNNDEFYVVITWRLCVLYGSQNKQQPIPYTTLTDWILWPRWEVYCAVRTESLYNTYVSS
jgi:hypothetical protein